MWFTDILSKAGQYAWGQANAAYVMLVDALGVPLATNNGALTTFEMAAMGYDPSTGRTPVEQTNNNVSALLSTASQTLVVKAAPGFLHTLTVSCPVAGAVGTHLALYDNSAASGTAYLGFIPLPAAGAAPVQVTLDCLFATGLSIAPVNLSIASGVVTPTNQAQIATSGVLVSASYR
jgi:hypothetical protein